MALPTPSDSTTALITGASAGIGVDIARELAQRGHGLTLVARREERLRSLAEELSSKHGVRAEAVGCDVSDEDARRRLTAGDRDVSILVNNAGFSTLGRVSGSDEAREVALVKTNVEAVVSLTSLFLPGMVERGQGAILNVASTAAFQPIPYQAAYAASKAFVLSYTDGLYAELRGSGVTTTALCPGPVKTEFADVAGFGADAEVLPEALWSSPEEVASAAVRGLEKGKRVVIPGAVNRVTALSGQHTPRTMLLPLLGRFYPGGGSKD